MIKKFLFLVLCLFSSLHAETIGKKIAKNSPPQWMEEQLAADFAPLYPHSISHEMIDAVMANSSLIRDQQLMRCRIQNRKPSFSCHPDLSRPPSYHALTKAIRRLACQTHLPDIDCLISLHDLYSDHPDVPIPVLSFCKDPAHGRRVILIPDAEALEGNQR